jgi:hypothetical protein
VAIDCFSQKVWARPLVTKSAKSVLDEFKLIIKETGPFEVVVSDCGTEFTNREFLNFCKSKKMAVRNPRTSTHAAHVERVQRTLQSLLYRSITALLGSNVSFIDRFEGLVKTYNSRRHRSIGLTPEQGEKDENKFHIQLMHQKYYNKITRTKKIKFVIGDRVRVAKERQAFHRGYKPQSVEEIYFVDKVNKSRRRVTYELATYSGEKVCHNRGSQKKGSSIVRRFYQEQLTKVVGQDVYEIEEILDIPKDKEKYAKKHNMMYVKWVDYAEPSFTEKRSETLLKDIP